MVLRHPEPLATASPTAKHIPALDGLRGLAILLVLLVHLGGGRRSPHLAIRFTADTMRLGWIGVSLFFVLSGFLISGILWDSFACPGWWKRFYFRRSLRIFPLYYLSLAYAALVTLAYARVMRPVLLVNLIYLQDLPWFEPILYRIPLNRVSLAHFWSLAVEEQFYLLWPFLLFAFRRNRTRAMHLCLALILASLAWRYAVFATQTNPMWSYHALPGRAGELALGAWLALVTRGSTEQINRLFRAIPWAAALSFAALLLITLFTRGSFEVGEPAWLIPGLLALPLLFACMVAFCLRPGPIQHLFENPLLRWYGKISYGVYVFHILLLPPFAYAVQRLAAPLSQTTQQALESLTVLLGSTAAAALSFYTYESYFLRLKDRKALALATTPTSPALP